MFDWITFRLSIGHRLRLLIFCVCSSSLACAVEGGEGALHLRSRSKAICGVNAAYLFLRLHGAIVDYQQLEAALPVESAGLSMLQLKQLANRHGVESIVRRAQLRDIPAHDYPIICLLKPTQADQVGHYIVLVRREGSFVQMIDGTRGSVSNVTVDWLEAREAGHYLCARASTDSIDTSIATSLFLALLSGSALGLLYCVGQGRSPSKSLLIFVMTMVCGRGKIVFAMENQPQSITRLAPLEEIEVADAGQYCRHPENDAVNAVYIWLRLAASQSANYERLWAQSRLNGGFNDLLEVRRTLGQHGFEFQLIRCKPEAIKREMLPAITLVTNHDRPERRDFAILIATGNGLVYVVRSAYGEIRMLPIDQFRRDWCGVLLVSTKPSPGMELSECIIIGVLLTISGIAASIGAKTSWKWLGTRLIRQGRVDALTS